MDQHFFPNLLIEKLFSQNFSPIFFSQRKIKPYLLDRKFFMTKTVLIRIFLTRNFVGPNFFFTKNFFWPKSFVDQSFFYQDIFHQMFFTKIFSLKFFLPPKFFQPKFFLLKILFDQQYFFLTKKSFLIEDIFFKFSKQSKWFWHQSNSILLSN